MKKIILLFILAFGFTMFGQNEKGSMLVGVGFGALSFTDSKNETTYSNTPTEYSSDGNSFSISINPNVAWFVKDNLAIGGGVSLSYYSSKSDSSNTSSTTTTESKSTQPSFYIGPMARYYFGKSASGKPFTQLNAQYGVYGGKSESTSSTGSGSQTTTKPKGDYNFGATFGYEYFISKYVGLYVSLGLNYGTSKTEYEYEPSTGTGYSYTSTYSRIYVPVNFGLQVHLPSKKAKE